MAINLEVLYKKFGLNDEMIDISKGILSRMDYDTDNDHEAIVEDLWNCMNDELIYTIDQWEMMKYYCTPTTANFEEAWDGLFNDLMDCIEKENVFIKGHKGAFVEVEIC